LTSVATGVASGVCVASSVGCGVLVVSSAGAEEHPTSPKTIIKAKIKTITFFIFLPPYLFLYDLFVQALKQFN
jgi:hypothetical protein